MSGTVSTRWYFPDWMSDTGVRASSLAARGLWMDLLCIAAANKGKDHGFVLVGGRVPSDDQIAKLVGSTSKEVNGLLSELEQNEVFSRDRRRAIYSRRMVRAEKNRTNGRLGGNPNLLKNNNNQEPVQPDPKALIPVPKPEPIILKKEMRVAAPKNRGCRIDPEWKPSDVDIAFAKQEGFNDFETKREANKFRDYWIACAGAKGVKLDWRATWRQWIRNGAERSGKTPPPNPGPAGGPTASGYYAKADTDQLAAWDAYSRNTTGKTLARDRNGGWHVKSEWPPGHGFMPLDESTRAIR